MRCRLCGHMFEATNLACHASCPLGSRCSLICCPNCGYQVVDESKSGLVTTLAKGYTSLNRLTWSADGAALWLTASRTGGDPQQIYKVDLSGRERVAVEIAGGLILMDISRSGQMLVRRGTGWRRSRASREVDIASA